MPAVLKASSELDGKSISTQKKNPDSTRGKEKKSFFRQTAIWGGRKDPEVPRLIANTG